MRRESLRIEVKFRRPRPELMLPPRRHRRRIASPHRISIEQHPRVPRCRRETQQGLIRSTNQLITIPIVVCARVSDERGRTRDVLFLGTKLRRPNDIDRDIRCGVLLEPRILERNCAVKTLRSGW